MLTITIGGEHCYNVDRINNSIYNEVFYYNLKLRETGFLCNNVALLAC